MFAFMKESDMEKMTEKKALFIATVGGFVTQFEMNNVHILQQMGYEVHSAANFEEPVYCVKEPELKEQGVILHQIDIAKSPFLWRQNLRALKQICEIVRTCGITLIHCHTPVGGLLGRLAGIMCSTPELKVVYTAHGFHFYTGAPLVNWLFYYTVERFLARFTDCLITINQEDYDRARRFRLRSGGKVYKIPGEGLHTECFAPGLRQEREKLRQKLGISEDTFFILSVGELSGNKNHRRMIDLMPDIQRQISHKKVFYGICGDGFYRQELDARIRQPDVKGRVEMYGHRSDVAEFLACADCFLFPSVREGLGMAALEALSVGVPVVASDNRGTREYMKDGVNGFVCNVKRPEEFVRAVADISRMPEEDLEGLRREGIKTAEGFEWRHTHEIMKDIYRSMDTEKFTSQEYCQEIRLMAVEENGMRKAQ